METEQSAKVNFQYEAMPAVTAELNKAFAKAQAEFIQPEKNKVVEVKKDGKVLYSTKYADLKNVIESFRPFLCKNGLSFNQKTVFIDGHWHLCLVLRHESGEIDESFMPINLNQMPQQVGSTLTYLKRYQAAAYFGIAADDDDDGNAAHGNQADVKDKDPNKKPASATKKQQPPAKPQNPEDESQDPGDFIIPIGNAKGKKIRELNESTLVQMKNWATAQLKITPPVDGVATILELNTKVTAFLHSVGVQI